MTLLNQSPLITKTRRMKIGRNKKLRIMSNDLKVIMAQMETCMEMKNRSYPKHTDGTSHYLFYKGKPLISIGPDWKYWTGIITFISLVSTFGWIVLSYISIKSLIFGIILMSMNIMVLLYILLRSSSYPDLKVDKDDIERVFRNKQLWWRKWKVIKTDRTIHWDDCDICITEYDHHCPWMSKCIWGTTMIIWIIFYI